tara:strand:- start:10553 stop:11728 length:1176 start_codon:yes stop_codon:yes gene_type:complete
MNLQDRVYKNERKLALVACLLITFGMGSIHAFSTLIEGIELQTNLGRMSSSLIYSTALINGTLAVFVGHILYQKFSAIKLIALMAILPVIGLFFSNSESWIGWIIGYGIFFGFSSGIGYGLSLHIASLVTEKSRLGFALGLITASYAFGAVIFSVVFPVLFNYFGFENGYMIGVGTISIIVMIALFLLVVSKVQLEIIVDTSIQKHSRNPKILKLWVGYFLGVFAGLMIIAHAVPLIISLGGSVAVSITAISLMSLGSGVAGLCAGWLVDQFGCKRPLLAILIINAIAIFSLSVMISISLIFILLVLIASLYGAIIAIYPTLVNHLVGPDLSAKVYGRVFTAWGAAGLLAPSLAGWLYEQNNNYDAAILLTLAMSITSLIVIWRIKYSIER